MQAVIKAAITSNINLSGCFCGGAKFRLIAFAARPQRTPKLHIKMPIRG